MFCGVVLAPSLSRLSEETWRQDGARLEGFPEPHTHRNLWDLPEPRDSIQPMVYTSALKEVPYQNFGAYACTMQLCGAFGELGELQRARCGSPLLLATVGNILK